MHIVHGGIVALGVVLDSQTKEENKKDLDYLAYPLNQVAPNRTHDERANIGANYCSQVNHSENAETSLNSLLSLVIAVWLILGSVIQPYISLAVLALPGEKSS